MLQKQLGNSLKVWEMIGFIISKEKTHQPAKSVDSDEEK